jgi:hypothetical protein
MDALDRFLSRANIDRYRKLAIATTDSAERSLIMRLLAEELTQLKLELRRRNDAPKARSPVDAATETVEHDEEGRRSGG